MKSVVSLFRCFVVSLVVVSPLFAEDRDEAAALTTQIASAKSALELYEPFTQLKDLYFKGNKYSQFVEFLKSLATKNKIAEPFIDYYIALGRYQQLEYLEQTQNWDEYFAGGNTYRDELTAAAQQAINQTTTKEPINLYARLLLWKFHLSQLDAFEEEALTSLVNGVIEYAQAEGDIPLIRQIADELYNHGQRAKSHELYRLYVNKLNTALLKEEELVTIASGFYKEGNLELAEIIYDTYLEKIIAGYPKEKSLPVLIDLAKTFCYQDRGLADPFYAEKIFKRIEEVAGKEAFDQGLLSLRAFNLEKAKDYKQAARAYLDLVSRYPASAYAARANYKVGIISAYALADINTAKNYFAALAETQVPTPETISSLYQLGLLTHWLGELNKAEEYYQQLIKKAGKDFMETVALAEERIKEIAEKRPMDYNLKMFLNLSLQPGALFDTAKLGLKSRPYRAVANEKIQVSATPYLAESGCMQPELQYLWSGDIPGVKPLAEQKTFTITFADKGIKVINLVVVSASGIIERSFDLLDVD